MADTLGPTLSGAIAYALQWPNVEASEDALAEMLEGLGLAHLETANTALDADSAARLDSAYFPAFTRRARAAEQSQLYQVLLYLQLEDSSSRLLRSSPSGATSSGRRRPPRRPPSRSQKDAPRALHELDWKHKYEVTAEGLSSTSRNRASGSRRV